VCRTQPSANIKKKAKHLKNGPCEANCWGRDRKKKGQEKIFALTGLTSILKKKEGTKEKGCRE